MSFSAPKVLVASNTTADHHDTGPGHPERPARLPAVEAALAADGLRDLTAPLATREARPEELVAVHPRRHLEALARLAGAGGGAIDADTSMSTGSWRTALLAAGSGLAAIQALDERRAEAAFVAVRPPGHHARSDQAMGFCLLNNVAVAAASLVERGERVLIFDWDVHHGNGTQDIFWQDPAVLFVSLHQWPCYPGTGRATETGGSAAPGRTVNVPLPPGATGDVALAAFDRIVAPVVDEFDPTWTLISAGFDAHRDDPLASLAWSAGDFALLARRVMSVTPEPGRLVAFLEGGYDLAALGRSAAATVAALAGEDLAEEAPTSGGPGMDHVDRALAERIRSLEQGVS